MYEFYIRNMCLNQKDTKDTKGSKRVRKEHYITLCCVRYFVNMLYSLLKLFGEFRQVEMGANDPQDMANLDPKDMVGKIYVGDH